MVDTDETIIRTNPDPTKLTTDAVALLKAQLLELFQAELAMRDQRLDQMDKAVVLVREAGERIPGHMKEEVGHLKNLHNEKFASIDTQFRERDTRVSEAASTSKVAVDAALSAQKEAVEKQNTANQLAIAKSEAAVTKQIDALVALIATAGKASDDKVSDIKERITRTEEQLVTRPEVSALNDRLTGIEQRTIGVSSQTVEHRQVASAERSNNANTAQVIGIAFAALIGISSIIITISVALTR